jgi:hypothetical protein
LLFKLNHRSMSRHFYSFIKMPWYFFTYWL